MIDFRNVCFTYDGQRFVLDDVSLHVEPGQFVCILGGNGSGKSTLAAHVNALLVPDSGSVRVLGKSTGDPEATYFIRSKAGMVFQNPDDQLVASLIENDVAFGPENLGLPAEELRTRVTEALEAVGLQGFEKKETNALSGGQKQRVAIAGMLAMRPQILVLDEASAMLDPRGRAGLLRVCRELNSAGMTIVMITHFMEEAAYADVVYVLEGGKVALSGTPEYVLGRVEDMEELCLDIPFAARASYELAAAGVPVSMHVKEDALADELAALLGGKALAGDIRVGGSSAPLPAQGDAASGLGERASEVPQGGSCRPVRDLRVLSGNARQSLAAETAPESGSAPPLVEFEQVWYSYDPQAAAKSAPGARSQADWGNDPGELWALRDLSFVLHAGEFLGIAGHTGSGKSTLVQHMNGLVKPTKGVVRVSGEDIANAHAAARARKQVGLVFQYPEHQLFAPSVYDDVAFGPRNMGVEESSMDDVVRDALALVELDFEAVRAMSPFELSGGQQRRVALAGVLACRPSTLVLDEPAAGLDPEGRRDLLDLVRRLHADMGTTVVMISHSMDDLASLCDRILVLNQGAAWAMGAPAEVFSDAEACKQIGLDVPSPQRLARLLADRGLHLYWDAGSLPNREELVKALAWAYREGR